MCSSQSTLNNNRAKVPVDSARVMMIIEINLSLSLSLSNENNNKQNFPHSTLLLFLLGALGLDPIASSGWGDGSLLLVL